MTILIFFGVLVLLILVHEFGHFIVAKKSGIRVDEFGIGFPPKLFGKKFGETEYTLNLLPIGGFVRIWGEDPSDEHYTDGPESKRSFVKQPKYIQALVLVAGVSMNILLAYVLYASAYMIGMPTSVGTLEEAQAYNLENVQLFVSSVNSDTPASEVLQSSDVLLSLTTEENTLSSTETLSPEAVSSFISASEGKEIEAEILRRNEQIVVSFTPEQGIIESDPERYAAGFMMTLAGTESYSFFPALLIAGERTFYSLKAVFFGMFELIGGAFTGSADLSQVSGPVGIVNMVGDAAALGFTWLLTFSAYISLNLAVINLLPFPALDGGRLVFVAIESITRKPIKPIIASRLNMIGFIALLSLMLLVTVYDVMKLL